MSVVAPAKTRAGVAVEGIAVLTGWGQGIQALPADAARAAAGRAVISLPRPELEGERFRRATRECLLGVAVVDTLLREHHIARDTVRGSATALIYVTGGAYGASNHAWVAADTARPAEPDDRSGERRRSVSGTLHFPYTAPSVMSGEVAIEFGLTGPYGILIGGAAATIDGLWQATVLLAAGRCERALAREAPAGRGGRVRVADSRRAQDAVRCATGALGARSACARPGRRDARLRAAHRAGARARGQRDGTHRRHG